MLSLDFWGSLFAPPARHHAAPCSRSLAPRGASPWLVAEQNSVDPKSCSLFLEAGLCFPVEDGDPSFCRDS